ncbi:MAG: MBL fold metallo-hydrolase [Lachnospiraceae bacterium]|nr:MBL fold metallo-hydrolase [Lachnospiraceae bacterium]
MYERIKVKKLTPYIYLLDDMQEASGYLVVGKEKALVVDTMNGCEDVNAVVREITDLPVMVVNTHGHPDHIFGNVYFDKAYINPADLPIAEHFINEPQFAANFREHNLKMPEFAPINPGEEIDLGGVLLEVIGLPGHTPGGICLFIRKDGILFTGDSVLDHTWMHLEESLPMEAFLENLHKLKPVLAETKYLLTGHHRDFVDVSFCKAHRDAVAEVCAGKNENDIDYEWFGGVCKAHPYMGGTKLIVYDEHALGKRQGDQDT